MSDPDAIAVIHAIRQRLVALAENTPYRFVNTSAKNRAAYEAKKRLFTGYSDVEIAEAEAILGVCFPAVYRAYLKVMGITHGDLFRGSQVASIDDFKAHREFAEELIKENKSEWRLDDQAIVFLQHQGYTFCYFIADGGFDGPIYQYVEGKESANQCAASFAEMLDAEVSMAEEVNSDTVKQGGYFLTVEDGYESREYPALADGIRPLDGPPEINVGDYHSQILKSRSRSWWQFWR